MRIKTSLMLAGPALITAVTLGPVAASPASAAQTLAETTVIGAQTSTHVAGQPPRERQRQRQYNRGRETGYTEGRAACSANKPYNLKFTGSDDYQMGFADGYNSGFNSCTAPR
ncbi:hypothetical protein [Nonomuraea sp. NPDC049400]|uniref:hypothetical protein n=1 Tax=Nonomuraea sp. NPDC049400 TaxID=3364352 RepID=UPI00378CC583